MTLPSDPFHLHPELRGKIIEPAQSFFRTFRVENLLEEHPELAWITEFLHSDEKREALRHAVLADRRDQDLWIFAYGSLMWDPGIEFSEVRRALTPRHARRFILKDIYGGRGNPESPGVMAALDHGDGCEGLIFRIAKDKIETETEILWRREQIGPAYHAEFVPAISNDQQINVLAFTADHSADQICGDITRDEQIEYLNGGQGILGTSLEYLTNIVAQFETLGIVDAECSSLLKEAQARAAAT